MYVKNIMWAKFRYIPSKSVISLNNFVVMEAGIVKKIAAEKTRHASSNNTNLCCTIDIYRLDT